MTASRTSMNKIAAIGSRVCVWPLKYFGIETFIVAEEGKSEQVLEKAVKSGSYAIILITESVYKAARLWIEERKESYLPAITVIPDATGTEELTLDRVSKAIRSAVGMDIA